MLDMIDAPEAPTTDITNLPPADRAALVLNSTKTEADLKQLAISLKAITLVNSPAGREQAHSLAMTARTARTTIEKAGKAARDDATKFSKAVIAEEARLIEIIQPEETRLLSLRNAWDAAEAARKEAELQKERDRIAAHQSVIERIKSMPGLAREARTADMATQLLSKLHAIDTSGLEEFKNAAFLEVMRADKSIIDIINAKQEAEAEQVRTKAEQEAEAARLAEERQRMEADRAEAARIQAEQQAELLAMQAKIKAQQEELDRKATAMAQQAAAMAARKAEAEKPVEVPSAAVLADDPRDATGQVMAGTPPPVEQVPALIQQPATIDEMHTIGNGIMYGQAIPTAVDLANTIAHAQGVPQAKAIEWLAHRADDFKNLLESSK